MVNVQENTVPQAGTRRKTVIAAKIIKITISNSKICYKNNKNYYLKTKIIYENNKNDYF